MRNEQRAERRRLSCLEKVAISVFAAVGMLVIFLVAEVVIGHRPYAPPQVPAPSATGIAGPVAESQQASRQATPASSQPEVPPAPNVEPLKSGGLTDFLFRRGWAYQEAGRYAEAVEVFTAATRLYPNSAEAHLGLALAYDSMGRYAEAVASYKDAIRLKPDDAQAHAGLILAYEGMGNHTEAKSTYEALQRLDPALAAELKPLFTPQVGTSERPSLKDEGREDHIFQELANVSVVPRFDLDRDLTMGQWTYKALCVIDKNTGTVRLALMLQIELQPVGIVLPPLFVEVQAVSRTNRIVGSGTLFAKRIAVMQKLPYWGCVFVDSFSDIDTLSIRSRP